MNQLAKRLMPPVSQTVNDWATTWLVILFIVFTLAYVPCTIYFPAAKGGLEWLMTVLGSFGLGRLSSEIQPRK